MAECHLVIIVSDTLCRGEYLDLSAEQTDLLVVDNCQLTIQKEPAKADDPWDSELQAIVVNKICNLEGWEAAHVRIAAHKRTCFKADNQSFDLRDRRFSDKEEQLKKELGSNFDVQVWGFHHADQSLLWKAIETKIINIATAADKEKIDFLKSLEEVFQTGSQTARKIVALNGSQSVWDQLSWLRHQVLALFHPLVLRLDTARERDSKESEEIKASILQSLGPKFEKAKKLLEQCRPIVTGEALKPFDDISNRLNNPPDLNPTPSDKPQPFNNFREWLNKLDSELNQLRDSVSKE